MSIRLIGLDKNSGMRTVSVGETWRRLIAKIVLKVTVTEATVAFQDDQMCAVLRSVIDGAVHGVQYIWGKTLTTDDWVFLLVNANNAFNEINLIGMLCTVRHLWTYGAQFFFNCYIHWSSLVLWNTNGAASFIHSREGATPGDPLAMIVYGIGIPPLIKNTK